ncbi:MULTISPECIES: fimbrial protein [Lelliottia]|jgi:type 1 fimbria pilin|uniref:Fimbrial-type adhesion domain-containing protein n=1 Tax=Lelliottia aquatilis TaxID=2080838 RepID=A0ABX5A5Z2_9ENTR|nr:MULTISPECIES: fimbrial protein [Lelliottia]NTZ44874.1 hypothetical protein [Lelliottia aquatilis]POZ28712.1 hypothetical protein C3711_06925 [Lelliottia aquatilis]POZ33636.1 hypothetical protein C3712_00565 [Lelliottia aquatilis]POZ34170.1 hypothetical protein C3708_00565 [Lelliottia sp. 7254-16]POZ34704.1 hypothetical protein C3710_04555 [Lelliottia aquatilis]
MSFIKLISYEFSESNARYLSNAGKLLLFALLICFFIFSPKHAYAFTCYNGSSSIYNSSGTFTVLVDAPILNKSVTDAIITDMSDYAKCYGQPDSGYKDALRSTEITISPELSSVGYEPYIQVSAEKSPSNEACLWPDDTCNYNYASQVITKPINAKLGISRNPLAKWSGGTTIPAGTEIMRMTTQGRGGGIWQPWYITWIFQLKNDMVIPHYTCSLSDYSDIVNLKTISVPDLQNNGPGKYDASETPFQFNLNCDLHTNVTVQFNGDVMAGVKDVLANKLPGNDNVGIQISLNDKPIVMGESTEVINDAQAMELVKLKAYYYYKGGDVHGGDVKAVAEFTFNYQ